MDSEIRNLEKKIDSLIKLCRELKDDNQQMKAKQEDFAKSINILEEKNKLARGRVESIVDRLKEMRDGEA